jgi:hypothetical protein
MTPALPAAKISSLKQDQSKLDEAIAHVNSLGDKPKRSLAGSLSSFMKKNPDPIVSSNTDPKKAVLFLAKFHLHAMAAKDTWKKSVTSKASMTSHKQMKELRWWNRERMDKEMGPIFAEHIRDSGLLVSRPNQLTKSNLPDHRQYACADDYELMTITRWCAL